MDPVLHALVRAAVDATAATAGWVLAVDGDELAVAAAAGEIGDLGQAVGRRFPATAGTAGYVAASGQPLAMAVRADDPRFAEGVAASLGWTPAAVACVPCDTGEAVVGVLELVDKRGAPTFSFDDVEQATVLASIAAAALLFPRDGGAPDPPAPDELAGALDDLAATDPGRYALVAPLVRALIGDV